MILFVYTSNRVMFMEECGIEGEKNKQTVLTGLYY